MEAIDEFLACASRACCSTFAIFLQIQGCCICLLLALGWSFAAFVRSREIRRMKRIIEGGNSFGFICNDINDLEHFAQINLPRVSVVMPLKGFGEHNLQNWRSQITSLYGGPLEFLFVVESVNDPAYPPVSMLISEFKGSVDAKIVVAGLSTTCSQKIHNQLVGVEKMHKDSKYVLFLDDDVRLHPGTIGALTVEMEKNPEIFIQTGYPLDLPSGSLGSYCIYEYHMPCSMGFATGGKTFFLWGGCMMMHAEDFRKDSYGVVTGLRDGGYSDDMTLAAIAGAYKKLIFSPPVAVFPHPLASDLTFPRYWNYLRKQTFVLESYIDYVNWLMNRALFSVHIYLSWSFVVPYFMAVMHVGAALRAGYSNYPIKEIAPSYGLSLSGCLAACTIVELLAMWNLTKVEVQLCNMLSPEGPRVSLRSYNWGLIFLAILVDNFLYPISAIRSHFSQTINWSGIRYHLKRGKVSKIERLNEKGSEYSDLGGKHLYDKWPGQLNGSFMSHQPSKAKESSIFSSHPDLQAMASSSSSGPIFKLHPLVIVNISDHYTRVKAQTQQPACPSGPSCSVAVANGSAVPRVFGCVIGVQRGRTVEIFNSFEMILDPVSETFDRAFLDKKQELYKKVFPSFYILGWYSTGSDAVESDMLIHKALMDINESPVYVLLNPSMTHAKKDLPVTIFETELHVINGIPQLIFVRSNYAIETVEAERISVDHVAHLKPSDGGSAATQLAAHLTGIHSAIKMLNNRIRIVHQYLLAMQRGDVPLENALLRQVSSLLRRLPAMESEKFQDDFLMEFNDTLLMTYLAIFTNCASIMNELIDKFNTTYDRHSRRGGRTSFI